MRTPLHRVAAIALAIAATACGADQATNPVRTPQRPSATYVNQPVVYYQAYVEGTGWQSFSATNGEVAGTTGQSLRMEALKLNAYSMTASDPPFVLCYQAHVENIGWQTAVCGNGHQVGTTGQDLRMEAVRIWAIDPYGGVSAYGVCYQAHVQDYGWLTTVCDGQQAGTTGEFRRMEAIKIWPYVRQF